MTHTAAYKTYFHIQQSLARRYISLPSFFQIYPYTLPQLQKSHQIFCNIFINLPKEQK
ncbi:hypothetical protein [uncultured Helicobacter sp.]|uniref:hypothetical protein n=1 Tax=uncultured Helicobacter sp. TaxID=175537 RepID=UPI0026210FA6|nr:hypothetical protein [uncultured Helicobacter sp.]